MPQVSEEYLESRKNMIAKAGIDVFSKKGYYNASMKDIMIEANVSRGGLYAHFDNISSVFIESLKYDDSAQLNQLSEVKVSSPLLPQLNEWIESIILGNIGRNGNLVRARCEFFLAHDGDKFPYLVERNQKLEESIKSFILLGIKNGEFKEDIDPNTFSNLLISMVNGIMLDSQYKYDENKNMDRILNLVKTMVESYLI